MAGNREIKGGVCREFMPAIAENCFDDQSEFQAIFQDISG